jgi:hypothetical protein
MRALIVALAIASLSIATHAQTSAPAAGNQSPRDLILAPSNKPLQVKTSVPRGYALIVGISHYKNLDASKQLRFPESDADAFYRVLISHVGGAFPSENVHFLKGPRRR